MKLAVGSLFLALREEAGLTQDELAERLAVPQQVVSTRERSKKDLMVSTLASVADKLGYDVLLKRRSDGSLRPIPEAEEEEDSDENDLAGS